MSDSASQTMPAGEGITTPMLDSGHQPGDAHGQPRRSDTTSTIPVNGRHLAGPTVAAAAKSTYAQILRSSAVVGGSTLLNVLIGIVRTKLMAMLLGPAGFGLMGAYAAITDVTRSIAEMGVQQSGVRQIAEAVGTDDKLRIARTVTVLRRVTVVLGIAGACLLALFAAPVAELTFGNLEHVGGVELLSLAVFFNVLAGGQSALLQGIRQISDLARVSAFGAAIGTVVSIPMIYFFRDRGVVPALVAVAAVSAAISWWYGRRLKIASVKLSYDELRGDTTSLLKLGVAFMVSGLLMMGAAYAVRVIVLRDSGLSGAGLYQAGWALGGLYVGFVLQAMGTDFYPRLVQQISDHREMNRLVNEQAHVSVLLAGPGVVATLALSPVLISLLFSENFVPAVGVLRWICIGMALRVITWPMGFIIVAKNRQAAFIATEIAWTVVYIGLSWLLVDAYGLAGAGMAFFASYVFHALMIYPIVRRMTGFRWSSDNAKAGLVFISLTGAVFLGFELLPSGPAYAVGILVLAISSLHSARSLVGLVGTQHVPKFILRLLSFVGLIDRRKIESH